MGDIVQFPGTKRYQAVDPAAPGKEETGMVLRTPEGKSIPLSEQQAKAINIVLGPHPFILVGIRPEPGGSGADIFTVLRGEKPELIKIHPQLGQVIDRAYDREGIPHD